jgi:anti-anti-sigma regulatory factor/ActR/RegA family two-component response regulator
VPKVLVSNNAELQRHFAARPFERLELTAVVVDSADEARAAVAREAPALAVLDAELGGLAIASAIKAARPSVRVILVAGRRLSREQVREVATSGCDELLISPMTSIELRDAVAMQLGEPRPGTEAFDVSVELAGRRVDATVSNLSVDGVRLVIASSEPALVEGAPVDVAIALVGEPAVRVRGTAVWAQPRDGRVVAGVGFDKLDEAARAVLARLTQWQISRDGERVRVVLRGDFTEATRFDELLPQMVGRVVFDLAQVTYMNSLGVRAWCEFLRRARIQGYELHACSVPFVLQASMVRDVLGRGTVVSFFAPFHCVSCDHQEERLLQTAAILASALQPPEFKCPACAGVLAFDDLPDRYFAFLEDDLDPAGSR